MATLFFTKDEGSRRERGALSNLCVLTTTKLMLIEDANARGIAEQMRRTIDDVVDCPLQPPRP